MPGKEEEYNIAAIRKLLMAAFTAKDLRRFCYDRPQLRPIVDRFGPGQGLDDMVDEAVTYCEKWLLFGQLLNEVRRYNPAQYKRCGPYRLKAGQEVYPRPIPPPADGCDQDDTAARPDRPLARPKEGDWPSVIAG